MSEVTCYKCGTRVAMDAVRCPRCGADFLANRPMGKLAATAAPSRSLGAKLKAFLAANGISLGGRRAPQSVGAAPPQGVPLRPVYISPQPLTPSYAGQGPGNPPPTASSRPLPEGISPAQNTLYSTVRLPQSERDAVSQPLSPAPPRVQTLSSSHARMRERSASQPLHPHQPLQPLPPGTLLRYPPQNPQYVYAINKAVQLTHSTYYNAVDLVCTRCGAINPSLPPDSMCAHCHAVPLQPVLIHEQAAQGAREDASRQTAELLKLSRVLRGVLPHTSYLRYARSTYTVCDHPGRWWVVRGRQSRNLDEAVAAIAQVAQVLAVLHEQGYTWAGNGHAMRESLILAGNNGNLSVADLMNVVEADVNPAVAAQQRRGDVVFLGELLMLLLSGVVPPPGSTQLMPGGLLPIVKRAQAGEYPTIQVMIEDLEKLPTGSWSSRTLKPRHGQATDPGLRHEDNQDTVVTFTFDKQQDRQTVPIGFYLVADGMGGHDAGGVASSTVYEVVSSWILNMRVLPDIQKATRKLNDDVSGDLLTQAIAQANAKLYEHSQARSLDMGSTVTAALVIGNFATVANVGDSRTYLLRQGRLEPITQDHSLVARLVSAGVIGPQEVRSHPQRNRIYRSLGMKADVEVDTFTVPLMRGDRLILCCDGLWEMVEDARIQRIVEEARTPQAASDALVAAANAAGGEDNISVIVVEME